MNITLLEKQKINSLLDFKKKYPSFTSGDLQTYVLGMDEGIRIYEELLNSHQNPLTDE